MRLRQFFLTGLVMLVSSALFSGQAPDFLKVIEGKQAPSLETVTWVNEEKPDIEGFAYAMYFFDPKQESNAKWMINHFNRIGARHADTSLVVLGLAITGDTDATREMAKKHGAAHPVGFDKANITDKFGFGRRLPYCVLVNAQGKVVYSGPPNGFMFDQELQRFVKDTPAPLLNNVTINMLWETAGKVQKLDFSRKVIREIKKHLRSKDEIRKKEAEVIMAEIDKYFDKQLKACLKQMNSNVFAGARIYLRLEELKHLDISRKAKKAVRDYKKDHPDKEDEIEAAIIFVEADDLLNKDKLPWIAADKAGVEPEEEWDADKMRKEKRMRASKATRLLRKLKRYEETKAGKEYERLNKIAEFWLK